MLASFKIVCVGVYEKMKKNKGKTLIIGVDEAGRGPLAGPIAVGAAVLFVPPNNISFWHRVRDSKKLSPGEREVLFKEIKGAKKKGLLDYRVSMVSHTVIDTKGLTYAARLGVKRALKNLDIAKGAQVLLDGSLYAPKEYKQRTITGGDDKYKIIGLASIVAKVKRDRRMKNISKKYLGYGFEVHAGYGTKGHYQAIQKNGISLIHRRSFLKQLTGKKK